MHYYILSLQEVHYYLFELPTLGKIKIDGLKNGWFSVLVSSVSININYYFPIKKNEID